MLYQTPSLTEPYIRSHITHNLDTIFFNIGEHATTTILKRLQNYPKTSISAWSIGHQLPCDLLIGVVLVNQKY